MGVKEADAQVLSDELARALARGGSFRQHDYYLLWLGHKVLTKYLPKDTAVLRVLVEKVESRDALPIDEEVREELAAFTAQLVDEWTEERYKLVVNGKIKWNNWHQLRALLHDEKSNVALSDDGRSFIIVPRP